MKATDLFTGVIHLFVIFLPGGILLVGVLFAVYPQVLTYDIGTLGFLGILAASYVTGHFLSIIAAEIEDNLGFDPEEVSPVLRVMATQIVHDKIGEAMAAQGNVRRWAANLSREVGGEPFTDVQRKDADRRFFRNFQLVLRLLVGLYILTALFYLILIFILPEVNGITLVTDDGKILFTWPKSASLIYGGAALTAGLLWRGSKARYKNQDKRYTQLVFEALLAHFREEIPKDDLRSTEIRWFFEKKPDLEILKKFGSLVERRCDHYFIKSIKPNNRKKLRLKKGEDFKQVGIKWREGQLEVKARRSWNEKKWKCGPRGAVETWVKSSAGEYPRPIEEGASKSFNWLAIHKQRYLLKYAYSILKKTVETHKDPAVRIKDHGCNIELTRLITFRNDQKKINWTLGFEVFSSCDKLQEAILEASIKEFFSRELWKI